MHEPAIVVDMRNIIKMIAAAGKRGKVRFIIGTERLDEWKSLEDGLLTEVTREAWPNLGKFMACDVFGCDAPIGMAAEFVPEC